MAKFECKIKGSDHNIYYLNLEARNKHAARRMVAEECKGLHFRVMKISNLSDASLAWTLGRRYPRNYPRSLSRATQHKGIFQKMTEALDSA